MEDERLQVFDANKNMLNESIERSNKKSLVDGKHFMIILFFLENNGKFLIQKCSEKKGGVYATTGGHVTFGDDGFITCKKEVKEELGISLKDEEIKYVDTIEYPNCFVEIYYSDKLTNLKDIKLQEEEVESVSFMSVEEIQELIANKKFRESNIPALTKVLDFN